MQFIPLKRVLLYCSMTCVTFLALQGLSSASENTIQSGDMIRLDYSCKIASSGELLSTTRKAVANEKNIRKSHLFKEAANYKPVECTAGNYRGPIGFEGMIRKQIADQLVGLAARDSHTLSLTYDASTNRRKEPQAIRMARVRRRPKIQRMTPDQYELQKKKPASVGDDFTIDPAVPGKVVSVSEKEVVIQFTAKSGTQVNTPFGPGTIREGEHAWEILVDAEQGQLVRTGEMIGRITDADERGFTVDYSHPYGFESLSCKATADIIQLSKQRAALNND